MDTGTCSDWRHLMTRKCCFASITVFHLCKEVVDWYLPVSHHHLHHHYLFSLVCTSRIAPLLCCPRDYLLSLNLFPIFLSPSWSVRYRCPSDDGRQCLFAAKQCLHWHLMAMCPVSATSAHPLFFILSLVYSFFRQHTLAAIFDVTLVDSSVECCLWQASVGWLLVISASERECGD